MSYLARLKAEFSGNLRHDVPTKPTDGASVSSVGGSIRPRGEIEGPRLRSKTAAENRRERALAMLSADPALRIAVICDGKAENGVVPIAYAIRKGVTCELAVPCEKFDPFILLDLIRRHGAIIQ